ncbi:protein FAR1-RELATED SEQUENCE 4-like isoform X2 [Cannabis sativa]|uniref:protein FAR1-RELATED SEQUENCE 4-like isoform X2 n=1 Tax=Cannabis sativa TaxID=3483 RepID=UPI0029CAAAF6|nr:protein FAR1-RELATED SEQUENCE 4-like isoform X2 [Cannabis sativa]
MFMEHMKRCRLISSSVENQVLGGCKVDLNIPTMSSSMDNSNVIIPNPIVEPHDGIEFESHEDAYTFYKEYAKSVGFGTAKLSSRRSRASKEFIDAKFSCIRYGNKQQSDDAINPRPSPKIGCKASMHVKRKQDDESLYTFVWLMQTWFIAMGEQAPRVILTDQNNAIKTAVAAVFPSTRHYFCLWHVMEKVPRQLEFLGMWHDSVMKKFSKCIFKSWSEGQFEKRWWKLIEKFNLRQVEWIQSLYEDRMYWVPTFVRDISFAGLSTTSRLESLNSLFDKYVQRETSLRDFMERYREILEDRYEEEAKANFDAWHETPELKSPSPFEKQMSLVYTHEIFKKFQVEVLGAAACHLKKENEDGTSTTYAVKDFEDSQNYIVQWNESKSDIFCLCQSFEYKGYLCRHAIVVLQMSGVFSIPSKYVLQRWTNAAMSRHPIGEKLDNVQRKVRRYNDLCRRAIILGEEGSLSEQSYNAALSAIKEALKQCANLTNSLENNTRPDTSAVVGGVCTVDAENQCSNASTYEVSDVKVTPTHSVSERPEPGKETASKKGKLHQTTEAASVVTHQGSFHQTEFSGSNMMQQLQNVVVPTQLHNMNMMPPPPPTAMFQTVSVAQFHNMAAAAAAAAASTTHLHHNNPSLPR